MRDEGQASDANETLAADTVVGPRLAASPKIGRGDAIGRYLVLGTLGEGGMGVVFAAHDPELDRRVAIKFLRDAGTPGGDVSQGRLRLQREAQAMARLTHVNVVAVHDVGLADGRVFVAMELIDGVTLRAWLAVEPRPWRDVLAALLQAGEGLAAAHRVGLVHRDFKPESGLASQVVENTSVPRLHRWYVPTLYQAGRPRQDRAARVPSARLARSRTRVTGIGARRKESTHHERLDQLRVLRSRRR